MRRIIGLAAIGIGILLVAIAAFALRSGESTSGDVAAVEAALRSEQTLPPEVPAPTPTTLPDPEPAAAEPPSAAEATPIAAPIGLRIEQLDVDAPVLPYGVDQGTGQMDVPNNVTDVGWYRFGPRPGEPGSAVLAAHVDLAGSGPGVFFNLRNLESGDSISVLHGDGSEVAYRVIARATYEKDELPLDVIFSREGPPVLTLITCGGAFNSNVSRYDSNVVVYAVPDDGSNAPAGSTL